jgi:hypothetical protein
VRLVSYRSPDGPRAGVLRGKDVFDAWSALGDPQRSSLRELIAEDRGVSGGEELLPFTSEQAIRARLDARAAAVVAT